MRRTNISDGNSTTRFFSRWIRLIMIGIAIVASPRKNAGVRKAMGSTHPHQPLAARQIREERAVERLGRVQQRVVDAMLRELRRQRVDVRANQLPVLLRERLRHDRYLLAALPILETRHI